MASKVFMDQTKKVFKNTSSNAANYWKLFQASEQADNIYHFCMKLFETVTNNSKDQFLNDDHEAMFSTLMLLEFYKNTKLKPERWLDETEKIFQQSKPKLYENARWIIKLYLQNSEEHQFALNFISSTVHIPQKLSWQIQPGQQIEQALKQAADYDDIIDIKKKDKPYKKLSMLAFDETVKESSIAAFSYCCFLDYVRSCNYLIKKKIWIHIVDNLKGLIHALRFSGKSYQLVTVYLHLVNQVLKFYGCHFEDVLKDIIYYVNLLRSSPGYNADQAQIVFERVHAELKCPGNSFRREIKRRFVNIDFKKAESCGSKKYFLSYRKSNFSNPQFCTITNLRKLLIYNILGTCKHPNMSAYWTIIQPLDSDTTFDLYFKIMKIVDIANNLQTYESIQKLIRQSTTELFKLEWRPYRKLHKEEELELAEMINQDNPFKYFQFPNFQIVELKPEELGDTSSRNSLSELIQEIRQYPYNDFFFSSGLEFIFLGNDEQLLELLQIFCQHLIQLPPNQYQKISFYLIPTTDGSCSLAKYISVKDLWYKRYVYDIFRKKLIFPYVSAEDPEIKDTFPMYLYIKSVHMYLREAERKVPFQIFQCDLSLIDREGKTEAKTVYFLNSILMGVSIEAVLAKRQSKKEKKQTHIDALDFYLEKAKKNYMMIVDINARYKEPGTEDLVTRQEKNLSVEDIQICSTPRPYFLGYKPNPTSEFIQVSILSQSSGRVFKNELQSKQNFKRHTDLEIAEAFRDLFINMTVQSIVIQRSQGMKDMLKLIIDGVEFNDVDKMKVAPAYTSSNLPMTLPVKCFLPFES